MKKVLVILLAMMLATASTAALAAGPQEFLAEAPASRSASPADPSFTKKYTDTTTVFPAEKLSFTVAASDKNPATTPVISVGTNNEYTVTALTNTIPVNVPAATAFTKPGKYTYTVKETAGSTQGVTYTDAGTAITVDVYVAYNSAHDGLEVLGTNVYTEIVNEKKKDEIENKYEVGTLAVSKTVTGSLADMSKEFEIEVVLTAANTVQSAISISATNGTANPESIAANWSGDKTITLKLTNGGKADFSDIPVGVTYTVKEKGITDFEDTPSNQIENANDTEAYAITYGGNGTATNANSDSDGVTGTISTTASTATVTNKKDITVPTGIALDSLPYMMILAMAVMGAFVLMSRRKEEF